MRSRRSLKVSHTQTRVQWLAFTQPQSRILGQDWVEICKLCIIARIWKPLSAKFSDLCREMGICLQI